jgi:hypothetical protein
MSPGRFHVAAWNQATTASFHILCCSLFQLPTAPLNKRTGGGGPFQQRTFCAFAVHAKFDCISFIARFQVLAAVTIKNVTILVVTRSSLVLKYKAFGDICSLHLEGRSDFEPEDEGCLLLRNVGIQIQNYTVSQPRISVNSILHFNNEDSSMTYQLRKRLLSLWLVK